MLFHLFHRCVYEWMGDVCARFFLASLSNDRATFNRFEHNSHTHAHFVVSEVAIALLYLLNYRLICFVHQFVSFCFTALRCCLAAAAGSAAVADVRKLFATWEMEIVSIQVMTSICFSEKIQLRMKQMKQHFMA